MTENNVVRLPSSQNYIHKVLRENFVGQNEFCRMIDFDSSYLSKLIGKKHEPTDRIIRKIALGLSTLDGQEWKIHAKHINMELR